MSLVVKTIAQLPEYEENVSVLNKQTWPEFLRHGDDDHWKAIFRTFPGFQMLFISGDDLAGVGHTVPLYWNHENDDLPSGIEDIILSGMDCIKQNQRPNALAALAVMVSKPHRRKGMSTEILNAMKMAAKQNNMEALIVPVRPTLKSRYPMTPFDQYVTWKSADGGPFDPWLKVHCKMGATVLKIAPKAMIVEGTVAQWEYWTGMRFPSSGDYIVKGALQPVSIDRGNDIGRYEDPNLWMLHAV